MKPEESSALSSESSSCCTPVLDSNKNYNNENVFDKQTDIGQYNDNKIVSSDHENFSPSPNNTFALNSETNNNNSSSDFSIKNEVNENLNLINNKTQSNLELESISNSKSFLPEPGFTDVKKVFGESLSESFLDSNKTIKNDTFLFIYYLNYYIINARLVVIFFFNVGSARGINNKKNVVLE